MSDPGGGWVYFYFYLHLLEEELINKKIKRYYFPEVNLITGGENSEYTCYLGYYRSVRGGITDRWKG
jgi:hypothetical protein